MKKLSKVLFPVFIMLVANNCFATAKAVCWTRKKLSRCLSAYFNHKSLGKDENLLAGTLYYYLISGNCEPGKTATGASGSNTNGPHLKNVPK